MDKQNNRKRKSSIFYLFAASFTFITVAFCLILTNILVKNTNPNISLLKTINVILTFSFLMIAFIILKAIYKDLIFYRILKIGKKIKEEPIYQLKEFDLRGFKNYVANKGYRDKRLYVIKDKALMRGNISYHFYFLKPQYKDAVAIINEFKAIKDSNENKILIIILNDFNLSSDDIENINSYDKAHYMTEYLSLEPIRTNILITAYDDKNKSLCYYRPKSIFNTSGYMNACRLIKKIYNK